MVDDVGKSIDFPFFCKIGQLWYVSALDLDIQWCLARFLVYSNIENWYQMTDMYRIYTSKSEPFQWIRQTVVTLISGVCKNFPIVDFVYYELQAVHWRVNAMNRVIWLRFSIALVTYIPQRWPRLVVGVTQISSLLLCLHIPQISIFIKRENS